MAPTEAPSPRSRHQDQEGNNGQVSRDEGFSARIESFRDISSEFEYSYYNNDELVSPLASPVLRGRESLVSLPRQSIGSIPDLSRSTSRRWPRPFSASSGAAYQPVAGLGSEAAPGVPARSTSARNAYGGSRFAGASSYAPVTTILEDRESIDIALLPAAAPIDGAGDSNAASAMPSSSTLKPDRPAADDETRWRQEQEQAGRLTGGLGAGFQEPAIKIRENELSSPISPKLQRIPSRAMSFSRRKSVLSRSATRKALGQSEADRTGQAVQVIVEEPDTAYHGASNTLSHRDSEIDLSFVAGDTMPVESEELRDLSKRDTMLSSKKVQRVETFYPHPDWKPFSMRWPYLLMLIMLSFVLAGLVELLYQHSAKRGFLIQFHMPSDIRGIGYFSVKFLPTLLAVIYGVLWQIADFEVKRLEAYYQLSKEQGATADETLNVDYITSYSILVPFHAFRRRHYAVTVSSIASILAVSAIPTLCSASIVLSPDRQTRITMPDALKEISINPVFSRINEAVLIIVALLGCVLFYQLNTRRSGLLADVKGIAGLAAMANVSHILMDFKDCDLAAHEDIHKKLKKHRYHLRNSALAPIDDENRPSTKASDELARITGRVTADNQPTAKYHLSLNPNPLMFRARGSIPFIVGILIFTIILQVYLFIPVVGLSEKAPWALTALAVCIKLAWGALDTTIRLMEPYFILYKRHAPPRTLTLDYTAMPFAWVAIKALLNGHWLVFAVGFGTVMTEILTVLVSSLATVEGRAFGPMRDHDQINAGEETVHSFWLSLGCATAILVYMMVVATVVFVRRRRPFLPRQPSTIASVLAFIHQSKMLYDFVGTEKKDSAEMLRFLAGVGKSYGMGWFDGRDGRPHCGIDEEELSATYRHGVDISRSNQPWVQEFTQWV